jgi:formylglycine-generating enzyme required for sulfatase activity
MTKIFISYKSEERSLPKALEDDLRAAGYDSVWWDVELVGGPAFRTQILEKLNAARAVIVIWTPRSVQSEFVLDEADHAKRDGKLIPVRVSELDTRDIPLGHRQAQTILLSDRARIIGALAALGVAPSQYAAPVSATPGNSTDERLWAEVRRENSFEGYLFYMRKFPVGAHAGEADDAIWQICVTPGDNAGYRRYLEALPDGRHSAVAEFRLDRAYNVMVEQYRREGRIEVAAPILNNPHGRWFLPGAGKTESFKDHEHGPEMVVVPKGKFMMGSTDKEIAALTKEYGDYFKDEGPQHRVTIPAPFAIGRYAVTFAEWDAFVAAGGGSHRPEDEGWGRGDRPVINVSWDDIQAYLEWLRQMTGKDYRLPSEAEWEYAARAGTTTPFWWGSSISTQQANYDGNYTFGGGSVGEWRQKTVPVKSFDPNPWGLYQVHGNVWEWCADPWHKDYKGAPGDGSVWGHEGDDSLRVHRGGSWYLNPRFLRSADRFRFIPVIRSYNIGFRLARTLNP